MTTDQVDLTYEEQQAVEDADAQTGASDLTRPAHAGHTIDLRHALQDRRGPISRLVTPRRTLQVLGVTGALLVMTALVAFLFGPLDEETEAAADTLASVTVPTTAAAEPEPAPPTTVAEDEPAEPADDGGASSPGQPAGDNPVLIAPTGVSYPIADLTLASDGIGPLVIGEPAEEVLSSLAASLDQPDVDSGEFISGGEGGTCVGDTIRTVEWGPLTVITGGSDNSFLGYALDARGYESSSPVAGMQTLSGLGIGDSVADLEALYDGSYGVEFAFRLGDGPIYRIESAGTLLLWGPVTSTNAQGTVQGIYSTLICES